MSDSILYLGEIGVVGGVLRPLEFALLRDGSTWDLTGYDQPELRAWDLMTKEIIALGGATTIQAPFTGGIVRYTPSAADPIWGYSGVFEGRVWVRPGAGAKEPSGLFRWSIGAGPGPA